METMRRQKRRMSRRLLALFSLSVVALLLAVLITCVVFLPPHVYPGRTAHELAPIADDKQRADVEDARLKLQNDFRTTLIQSVGGSVALIGAAIGAYVTYQQLIVARRGHVTDRITKAVDQIDDSKSYSVRVGGLYALGQVAEDAPENRTAMAEILVAYVQQHAKPSQSAATSDGHLRIRAPDVHAAMTVLGRMFPRDLVSESERNADDATSRGLKEFKESVLQLPEVDLRGAVLREANLTRAFLSGADLTGAVLNLAALCEADLTKATLRGASLIGADLYGAILAEADLEGAELVGADLRKADLSGAKLRGASAHATRTQWPKGFSAEANGVSVTGGSST